MPTPVGRRHVIFTGWPNMPSFGPSVITQPLAIASRTSAGSQLPRSASGSSLYALVESAVSIARKTSREYFGHRRSPWDGSCDDRACLPVGGQVFVRGRRVGTGVVTAFFQGNSHTVMMRYLLKTV